VDVVQLGCGVCGLVCAEQLAQHPNVDRLVLADRKTDAARALSSRLSLDTVSVREVDGTDSRALKDLLQDCDLVIASMPWRLNRVVLEAAAQVGSDYVDFGMPFDGTGPEFDEASTRSRDAGISALVGMGMEPGISDVLAMHAARAFDRVDEAHVFDGDTGYVEGLDLFSVWSPVDLLDEMSVPAAVYEDGQLRFLPPMSSSRMFDFPEPVGRLRVFRTNHDETYFLPMGMPTLRQASFNIHIDDAWVQAADTLRKLGLLRNDALDVHGLRVRPLEVIAAALPSPGVLTDRIRGYASFAVEVTGQKGGRGLRLRLSTGISYEDAFRKHRTNATAYMVGTGGAVAAEMLLEGRVPATGLVIPEQLDPEDYLARLRSRGFEIREERFEL
jgi:saccharopine dehydrogenase (NAD+, L-lysine-forming)